MEDNYVDNDEDLNNMNDFETLIHRRLFNGNDLFLTRDTFYNLD